MASAEIQSLGHVHFDTPSLPNYISEFLIAQEISGQVFRNKYVKIECADKRSFVGRIVDGPFFIPEEIDRGSAIAQTSILRGDKFPIVPNYYALARVELLGEISGGKLQFTNTRPIPKSPVFELTTDEVQGLVGSGGDMFLGKLIGYEDITVNMDAQSKKVLPRNFGIFGTVGIGKTNTSQVIIEEASANKYAVIVVDIEGEYISMDEPSTELEEKRAKFGLKAEGLKDFFVYYPVAGECKKKKAIPIDVEFKSMDPYVLAELLNFSDAQYRVFFELIDRLREKTEEKEKEKKKGRKEESEAVRFLTGAPEEEEIGFTIADAIRTLYADIIPHLKGPVRSAAYTLSAKLAMLRRVKIFDQPEVSTFPVDSMLKPGRVSIIDVSGCDDEVKNIVIAWLLKEVFNLKLREPEKTPKTLILIEEAHTFVSREARERMSSTLAMIRTIARRGRKRWLCLGFISQQPAHLPNEIFELCNTRIIHGIKSEHNLEILKATGGDIVEEVWRGVPGLGTGQAIISGPQFNHPIHVDIRPAKSKRELVD